MDLAYDITENFLVNGTIRYEDYSDFGNATVWKISSRYKFLDDKVTLRGSVSTGFRAPTLHQIYTQKSQYSFVPGQGIQISGIINNVSPQARILGVDKLKAEKSTNITFGTGIKVTNDSTLEITLKQPFAGFLNIIAMPGCWIYPQEAAKKLKPKQF